MLIVPLDMSYAFHRISHPRLLVKIRKYGIRNPLLSWQSSCPSNIFRFVSVSSCFSRFSVVISGVISGSLCGPFLFLLYNNDTLNVFHHGTPFLFAGDTKSLLL